MKRAFMNLKLSYRLFLIIIALFLVPYLALFSWSNAKAEKIIKIKFWFWSVSSSGKPVAKQKTYV